MELIDMKDLIPPAHKSRLVQRYITGDNSNVYTVHGSKNDLDSNAMIQYAYA